MKRLFSTAFAACLGLSTSAFGSTTGDGDVITFGIVPQQSASRLAAMWGPFLEELEVQTGLKFQFKTAKDIPTFEACLSEGVYDVAYMNPMHYAIFSREAGYQAFARQSDKRLKGIIVARKDAGLSDLTDLDSSRIAFPSPGAFGASILPRATLADMNVAFEPAYVNSHDSVYRAVASGLMPAGGGVLRTFGAVDPSIRDALTVLYETPAFTPHAFAVSEDFDAAFIERLQTAFMEMSSVSADLVAGIGMSGFEMSHDGDWDDVRALDMPRDASGILMEGQLECPSD